MTQKVRGTTRVRIRRPHAKRQGHTQRAGASYYSAIANKVERIHVFGNMDDTSWLQETAKHLESNHGNFSLGNTRES